MEETMDKQAEKKKLLDSIFFPAIFVALLWLVKIWEFIFDLDFHTYGIYPLHSKGLVGILTAPLVHADFSHLFSNSSSIFILLSGIFYFYRPVAFRFFLLSYLFTGIWVWFGARGNSYHIGASGLVYAYVSFLFLSGIIRKYLPLMAVSLLVVFWYGSLIWGIFPADEHISWESHLWGLVAGIVLAINYKKYGPQKPEIIWDDDDGDDNEPFSNPQSSDNNLNIKFLYKGDES